MIESQKRVAAIHDLSGFGRCSLAVVLPVLSVMGVQACPVPTAVLSSHTGGLGDPVYRDLSDYTMPALSHYKQLGISFDCVYSGFLGSVSQADHCYEFIKAYPEALAVVDPVMGDHGKPYKTCSPQLISRMRELAKAADLITPNFTESCLLLKDEYTDIPITQSQAKSMLARLSEMGPDYVIITSAVMADGKTANIGYDGKRNMFWRVDYEYLPVAYPGTGDIFASVVVGCILSGGSLPMAMDMATGFLEYAINTTFGYGIDRRYGVMFERCLSWLTSDRTLKAYKPL